MNIERDYRINMKVLQKFASLRKRVVRGSLSAKAAKRILDKYVDEVIARDVVLFPPRHQVHGTAFDGWDNFLDDKSD